MSAGPNRLYRKRGQGQDGQLLPELQHTGHADPLPYLWEPKQTGVHALVPAALQGTDDMRPFPSKGTVFFYFWKFQARYCSVHCTSWNWSGY